MYRLNRLQREVLITPDEVIYHAPTDMVIDERSISTNIIIAEERFIAPALTNNLYNDFCRKKNRKITEENREEMLHLVREDISARGDNAPLPELKDLPIGGYVNSINFITDSGYKDLWFRYLWKITAECVDILMITPSWVRSTSVGQQKNNPETLGAKSSSADLQDIKFKIDNALNDRIDPLMERMHAYICQNKSSFRLYGNKCKNTTYNTSGISYKRKSKFIFPSENNDYDNYCVCEWKRKRSYGDFNVDYNEDYYI